MQNKDSYRIDYTNKDVIRNFSKKFKFQTRAPFSLGQNIIIKQNKYFMELSLENEWNHLFLQSVTLKVTNNDLKLLDLNGEDEDGEIIGALMKKKEKRSFIYILEPKEESFKIKKNEKVGIGTVELKWQNMFGDIGNLVFGPFIYLQESNHDLELLHEKMPVPLILEEPIWVKVSIMNWTNRVMKLELDVDTTWVQNITIHGLSRYVLKKVTPGEQAYFSVLLFPQFTGIHILNGIIAKDYYSNVVYNFTNETSSIVFEVQQKEEEAKEANFLE